jgi:hypothetical protein
MTMTPIRFVAFLAVVLLPSSLVRAEDAASASAARRAQIVSSSTLGESFVGTTRQSYRVVVGLRAVSRGDATVEARLSELGLSASDLVEQKGNALVVQKAPPTGTRSARVREASALATVDGAPAYPVAVNTRTGKLGILTGTVVAKLGSTDEAAALASANGLTLGYVALEIGYAYFRVPAGRDIVAAAAALRKGAGVESANAEVTETFKVKR